jgi:hypothetical protein
LGSAGGPLPHIAIFENKGLRKTIFDVKGLRGKIRETREFVASGYIFMRIARLHDYSLS